MHGYRYLHDLQDLNINWHNSRPHSMRIYAALSLLTGNYKQAFLFIQAMRMTCICMLLIGNTSFPEQTTDWIVYFDADAAVAELSLPLELIADRAKLWAENASNCI
jgi:hypothetical protein